MESEINLVIAEQNTLAAQQEVKRLRDSAPTLIAALELLLAHAEFDTATSIGGAERLERRRRCIEQAHAAIFLARNG